MARQRFDRVVRVLLECGCTKDLNTSRYRVSESVAASIVNHAVRKGEWCFKHNATCQPTKFLGVFRA